MDVDPSAHEYDILLPGEAAAMAGGSRRDFDHWVQVYAELCQFKEVFLRALEEQRERVHLEGRVEVDHDDMVFRREYERLRRRLQYWQRRAVAEE